MTILEDEALMCSLTVVSIGMRAALVSSKIKRQPACQALASNLKL